MDKNSITIHDIARALKMDASTVSRALNNSERVTQKTKERILAKADELGYRRNVLASNLRKNKTNTIGVIVPRISRHFFSSAIAGIEETAYDAGYNVIICQSLEQLEREQKITQTLLSNRVDGVLISVSMETTNFEHFSQLKENGTHFLFFDRHCDVDGVTSILTNDFQGSFEATEHLILGGCRNIVHFSGPQTLKLYQNRLAGYKAALAKYSIEFRPEFVMTSNLMELDGETFAKAIENFPVKIDGIFAANDISAIGAIKYFKKKAIKIPDEIALVGFSNEPISAFIEPSLTTVAQSGFEMGKKATEILLSQIRNASDPNTNANVILNTTLIARDSSKKS